MTISRNRDCLFCGMSQRIEVPDINDRTLPSTARACIKCDSNLMEQSDGSSMTVDIAHQHETVRQAMAKVETELSRAWESYVGQLRLIVGGGLIREAVLAELHFKLSQGIVLSVSEENRGAVLIRIRSQELMS
jgi:hypothetical protein